METITIIFHNGTIRQFNVNMNTALNISQLLFELTKENNVSSEENTIVKV